MAGRIIEAKNINATEFDAEIEKALKALKKADKQLALVIKNVGPCTLKPDHIQSPFVALAESIIYQQLSGKAAATIFGRVKTLFAEAGGLTASAVINTSVQTLRGAGCSNAKAMALIDLAEKTVSGVVPTVDQLHSMPDDEIIERLVSIRGVGKWTVEMLLIFRLGRLDVMPATDYGIRKGFALTYRLADLPAPKEIIAHAEIWKPYRTLASWYLWRCLELPPQAW
ncbi:MAG: DNA-3-methyladenine glycosylase 2 family protein [Candidatus Melainabacteria bacterium]|nr:DNA-3-methyladenine glycosylase 2 family protein [Candidatus Melainabacteria bacterium]